MKDSKGFAFRQFTVQHNLCAMKVGTDGVLLGAWAEGGRRILDAGTGSGLIALMMAQRFANAWVDAIDIDAGACEQATQNAANSKFANRIKVYLSKLQQWHADEPYDSIVCNPPYFVNSLKAGTTERTLARHADSLPLSELMTHARRLLTLEGSLNVVLPLQNVSEACTQAAFAGMRLSRRCDIKTTPAKPAKRSLLTFTARHFVSTESVVQTLQDDHGCPSEWYSRLTSEFYLPR